MGRIVKVTLPLKRRATTADRRRWAALRAKGGKGVDVSDIPEITPADVRRAVRNPFILNIALDADVLEWLASRKDRNRVVNAALRGAMRQAGHPTA